MTSKELREVINTHLFVPITEEVAKQLFEVAKALVPGLGVIEADTYSRAFFQNKVSPSFRTLFVKQYGNTYGEGLNLPAIVFEILETSIVLLMIESDAIDAELRGKVVLIVRNNAILRKGDWSMVLCPQWIERIYSAYPKFGGMVFNEHISNETLINKCVSQKTWGGTGLDLGDQNVYNQLRSLCVSVVRERLSDYASSSSFLSISSPFARVYVLVEKMVNQWQWKFIDASPVKRIKEAIRESAKKRKALSGIVDDIKTMVPQNIIFSPKEKSSILLARVAEEKKSSIDSRMFSVLEFGVYLYYEMLLETYND